MVVVVLPASTCGLESVVRDWHRNGNLKGLVVKGNMGVSPKKRVGRWGGGEEAFLNIVYT